MVVHRIVVLGDGGVGKTALTIQLCLNHFVETYDPTIEDSYNKQVVIDDQPCNLEVLDTAGQEEYTALRDQWIRDGEAFLLVYSITSRATFYRIEQFREQILRVKDTEDVIPMMLVGNKCDRVGEREVSKEEGIYLASKLQCEFIETSAKTRVNVERAFYNVVRALRRQRELDHMVKSSKSGAKGAKSGKGKGDKECLLM
ncbi:putative small G-protein Ras2 [Chytriomyces sp. MP71]|nr:putative small G-protein Ras2 [Chytriomyces sp. MP71]